MLRWHGAKATMTSLMQHLNLSPKAVRLSGGWADKHESMADVYLREAQLMTLRSQERCLLYLRKGGDLGGLVGEPIAKDPQSRESPAGAEEAATAAGPSPPKSWSDEEVERALGNFAMGPAELAEEFLDEVLSRSVPDYTVVEAEKSVALDQEDVQSLLGDYDSPSEEATATLSLPEDGEDAESKRLTVPESEEAACSWRNRSSHPGFTWRQLPGMTRLECRLTLDAAQRAASRTWEVLRRSFHLFVLGALDSLGHVCVYVMPRLP